MSFKFNPCDPCCGICSGVNTTISGRVTIGCSSQLVNPHAGWTVTATGPATVSTTTDNLGNYTLIITKKGTYTVTAFGPCDSKSQTVVKNTCSLATTGINFSFPGYTVTVNYTYPCIEPGSGPRPYTSFYPATWPDPGHPAFPSFNATETYCANKGDFFYKVWDDECFVGQLIPVTVGCSDRNLPVIIEKKLYSVFGHMFGCLGSGVGDGLTVSVAGEAGSGTTTTDGGGNYTIGNMRAGCEFNITFSGPRYASATFPQGGSMTAMGCGNYSVGNVSLEPAEGYYCRPTCCSKPFNSLRVIDSMGTWPVDMNTGLTQCIQKSLAVGYAIAADFGSPIGVLCRPDPRPVSDGSGPITAAYRYSVRCNPASDLFNPGKWEVIRYVPGCSRRPLPFPDGPDGGDFPVEGICGPDGWPKAASGTTEYRTSGEAKFANLASCGSFSLGYSFSVYPDIGDATLVAN